MKFNFWKFALGLWPAFQVAISNTKKNSPGGRGWTKEEALNFKAAMLNFTSDLIDEEFQGGGIDLSDLSDL